MEMTYMSYLCIVMIIIGLIYFAVAAIKETRQRGNRKCKNCGRQVKTTNLFCPWCHADLRGGGKDEIG